MLHPAHVICFLAVSDLGRQAAVDLKGSMVTCLLCRLLCPVASLPTSAAAGLHQVERHRSPTLECMGSSAGAAWITSAGGVVRLKLRPAGMNLPAQ